MPQSPRRNTVAEWIVTALLLLFSTTSIVQAFVIPTGSMEGNPLIRHLVPYNDVKRGDIIVFCYPGDIKVTYLERAIGLHGDRIRVENQQVFLNGHPIDEPYKIHQSAGLSFPRDTFAELAVPAGNYFALGDKPRENIVGKPILIYWSFDAPTASYAGFGLDHVLDLAQNFFTKTRWNRTFKLIRGYPLGN